MGPDQDVGRFVRTEFEIVVYWIHARDRVRAAKEAGLPEPWTEDPLLRDYRWCNVRRLDDRVSRRLFENWHDDTQNPPTQLVSAVLGRLINWPDSLDELARPFAGALHPNTRATLERRALEGKKVLTGAYVVPGVPGRDKVDSVCSLVEKVAASAGGVMNAVSMRATWQALTAFDGLGSFLARQIVADLAHLHAGAMWEDQADWAPVGPGSARGMNRLLGRPKDKAVAQAEFEKLLPQLAEVVRPLVADIWSDRRLQAMDLQNCLCEFDKYRRLTLGEGKVRARYAGAAPADQGSLI